jgi:hypothetical protein
LTSSYHGQPFDFVDKCVVFYAVDDALRFHDFTDIDHQQSTTIQTDGIGVGVIVSIEHSLLTEHDVNIVFSFTF